MKDFDDLKKRLMENKSFRKVYEDREEQSELADIFLRFRSKHNLTREQMAKRYKIPLKTIEEIEDGELPQHIPGRQK